MDSLQAMAYARSILENAGVRAEQPLAPAEFQSYAHRVVDVVRHRWTATERAACPWLYDFLESWRALLDDFDVKRARDPMLCYVPRNLASQQFHQSRAFIRYFRAGNRTSKTQSGYAEDYFAATGQYPLTADVIPAGSVFIVSGLPFTGYAQPIYEKKLLTGEDNNPLSPMFPEGGKWFYHYDSKTYTLTLGCPSCAAEGVAARCPGHHRKTTIKLFSSENGVEVLEGFTAVLGHADEHVPPGFLSAMKMRVGDNPHGRLIVTGTPLQGPESWETKELANRATGDPKLNKRWGADPASPPYVTLHEVSQFDAGIMTRQQIEEKMIGMDEFEIQARVYGRPAALAKNPVFNRLKLAAIRSKCFDPRLVHLHSAKPLEELLEASDVETEEFSREVLADVNTPWTGMRVWEEPVHGGQYVIGVDTAAGLAEGDASCASVFRLIPMPDMRLSIRMVAQFHGWCNLFEYADEVFKLAVWYNSALAIVELTGGLGRAIVLRLRAAPPDGLGYWNIHRDSSKPENVEIQLDSRLGVDTNKETKPLMVGAGQQLLRDDLLELYCRDTIDEMVAYQQERTDSGLSVRFRGATGARDDRVMSLLIVAPVILTRSDIFEFGSQIEQAQTQEPPEHVEDQLDDAEDLAAWSRSQ